jgi:hypothetical protein
MCLCESQSEYYYQCYVSLPNVKVFNFTLWDWEVRFRSIYDRDKQLPREHVPRQERRGGGVVASEFNKWRPLQQHASCRSDGYFRIIRRWKREGERQREGHVIKVVKSKQTG